MDKFDLQDRHYAFPYHHLPHFEDGIGFRTRTLGWGLKYLCYLQHILLDIESLRPESILDVGCGDGRLLGMVAGSSRKLGIDLSERAVGFARVFHPSIEYKVGSVAELVENFDVVTMIEVLEHVPDASVATVLKAVYERLNPGGTLIISVPTTVVKTLAKHYRHYTASLLRQQLESAGISCEGLATIHLCPNRESFPFRLLDKLSLIAGGLSNLG